MINPTLKTIFDARASDGATDPMFVKGEKYILLEICMVAFTGTIKFVGSLKETIPDFGSARGLTNPYEYIAVKDYQDSATIGGDTGISGTATTDVRIVEVNANRLSWFGAIVSSYSGGSITLKVLADSENNVC